MVIARVTHPLVPSSLRSSAAAAKVSAPVQAWMVSVPALLPVYPKVASPEELVTIPKSGMGALGPATLKKTFTPSRGSPSWSVTVDLKTFWYRPPRGI